MKEWERGGIYNVIVNWINGLPSLDLFKDIDALVKNEHLVKINTYDESCLHPL